MPALLKIEHLSKVFPGQVALDDVEAELFEVLQQAPGTVNHPPDSPLWDCICATMRRHHPDLPVVPCLAFLALIPICWDARQCDAGS